MTAPRSCLRSRAPLRQGHPIVSIRYSEWRAEAGIKPSVGSGGDSYHSALTETINGLYKAEVIHRRGPCRNSEAVKFATLKWVNLFNHRRLLEPIGNMPPAEAEVQYYARLDAPAIAAELERNGLWQTRSSSRQPVSHGLSALNGYEPPTVGQISYICCNFHLEWPTLGRPKRSKCVWTGIAKRVVIVM
tara:strand:+ start:111 stop:677 length:567 start_codon:yes stop_codon:yes gene_type:complete